MIPSSDSNLLSEDSSQNPSPFDTWFKLAFRVLTLAVLLLGVIALGRNLLAPASSSTQATPAQAPSGSVRSLAQSVFSPSSPPAMSQEQRELAVARLARNAGAKLVKEHYDGGQSVETFLDSWWYQPEEKQYTADVTIKWNGSVFASNKYWVKGTLKLPETGSSYRFNRSDNSETLNDYLGFKLGVELFDALASETSNKTKPPQTDNFKGIGAQFATKQTGEKLKVDSLVPGTPAARSVLRAGDQIATINGQSTMPLTTEQCANLIRGSSEDMVVLVISRPFEPDQTLTLTKEVISVTR